MEPRSEIREFLTSRPGKTHPRAGGAEFLRQPPRAGLRREEVAVLAGVSVPYYTRIERGDMSGVSSVLEALARALQLDEAERAHLFDLARALRPMSSPRRRRAPRQRVRPSVQHVLDGLTGAAAFVHNARLETWPPTTSATPSTPTSSAAPQAPVPSTAPVTSSSIPPPATSTSTGIEPPATSSPCCAQHNVRFHDTGTKELHHPVVGDITLTYNRMELAADPGQMLMIWTAEPGSKSAEALSLLGSWAATPQQPELQDAPDHP